VELSRPALYHYAIDAPYVLVDVEAMPAESTVAGPATMIAESMLDEPFTTIVSKDCEEK
jgi:hypothetical protein